MAPGATTHYLRPNEKEWTPPAVVFLDSETHTTQIGDLELLQLRCWVAKLVDRREVRKRTGPVQWAEGSTAGGLAEQLTAWTRGRRSLWVYAHNLGFDLVTTALPVTLNRLGWRVTDFALRSQSPWMRLTDGRASLTVVDSWSWVQAALETVAGLYGARKEPLPAEDDGADLWLTRCRTDVELLSVAMLDLMDWWDRNRLGRWTISGAASGWNAFRHRPSGWRMLMEPDPERQAADRLAIRADGRDVSRVWDLGRGDFVEVDLTAAYPTVAATCPLPYRRGATFDGLPLDHEAVDSDRWGVLAEVTLRTDRPRYPVRLHGVTWYPVGEFRTVLAGPEIAWARDLGDLVDIGPGQFHQLGWAMADWAGWILDVQSGAFDDSPPIARMAARNWGRSVIGKMAARGSTKEALGADDSTGWDYLEGWDHEAGRNGALVNLCGQRWWAVYDTEGENTYPAVLAWVESHVRRRLGAALDLLPTDAWVTCDTDGFILDAQVAARWAWERSDRRARPRKGWAVAQAVCDALGPAVAPLVLRPKKEHGQLRVQGSQHVISDVDRKLSGVRRGAEESDPWTFTSRDWPSMRWQMRNSAPGDYARPLRTMTLDKPLAHRWVTEDGNAWPVWARLGADRETEIVPWAESWGPHAPSALLPLQYEGLAGLY